MPSRVSRGPCLGIESVRPVGSRLSSSFHGGLLRDDWRYLVVRGIFIHSGNLSGSFLALKLTRGIRRVVCLSDSDSTGREISRVLPIWSV